MQTQCPHCKTVYSNISASFESTELKCVKCKKTFTVTSSNISRANLNTRFATKSHTTPKAAVANSIQTVKKSKPKLSGKAIFLIIWFLLVVSTSTLLIHLMFSELPSEAELMEMQAINMNLKDARRVNDNNKEISYLLDEMTNPNSSDIRKIVCAEKLQDFIPTIEIKTRKKYNGTEALTSSCELAIADTVTEFLLSGIEKEEKLLAQKIKLEKKNPFLAVPNCREKAYYEARWVVGIAGVLILIPLAIVSRRRK